jgi:SnoaL-like protein
VDAELREWLDRLAIQDLIFRYSDAVTRADWAACEAVFAPDVIWESPLGLRFDGRAVFLDMLRETTTNDLLIQTSHSPVITLTGPDRATATTTVHELSRGLARAESELGEAGAEVNIDHYGLYYDEIERIDGAWKFTHRVFVPVYTRTGDVTGHVFTSRASLSAGAPPSS